MSKQDTNEHRQLVLTQAENQVWKVIQKLKEKGEWFNARSVSQTLGHADCKFTRQLAAQVEKKGYDTTLFSYGTGDRPKWLNY